MFSPYRFVIRRAARRAIIGRNRDRSQPDRGRFTGPEANRFVNLAWNKYQGVIPTLPSEPTRGSRMNVQLAALTISLFQVLLETGIERTYAIELISDMTWQPYAQLGRLNRVLTRILPRSLTKPLQNEADVARHVNKDGTFALGFPFDAPGYIAQYVPMKGAAAFDMICCPVAQVFRDRGAVDLCLATWCNLDYSLAEIKHINGKLHRTTTLVQGADRGDFRIIYGSDAARAGTNDRTEKGALMKARS